MSHLQTPSGGKSGVRMIQVDDDWRKLCHDLGCQPCVMDVSVSLNSEILSPCFERVQLVCKSLPILDISDARLCRVCSQMKLITMKRSCLEPR